MSSGEVLSGCWLVINIFYICSPLRYNLDSSFFPPFFNRLRYCLCTPSSGIENCYYLSLFSTAFKQNIIKQSHALYVFLRWCWPNCPGLGNPPLWGTPCLSREPAPPPLGWESFPSAVPQPCCPSHRSQ